MDWPTRKATLCAYWQGAGTLTVPWGEGRERRAEIRVTILHTPSFHTLILEECKRLCGQSPRGTCITRDITE